MLRLLLVILAATACAAEPVSLLPVGDMARFVFNGEGGIGKKEELAASGLDFASYARVSLREKPKLNYAVNMLCTVDKPVVAGDTLELDLWACGEPGEGVERPVIDILHQLAEKPWTSLLNKRQVLTASWTRYRLAYRAGADHAAGTTRIALFFGAVGPQTVQVGGVACRNHGAGVAPESLGIPVVAAPAK